jgi:hypothetical protein
MLKSPAFLFPTTIYMMDDDKHFMHMLSKSLPQNFNVVLFDNSIDLIDALNNDTILCMDAPKEASKLYPFNSLQRVKQFMELGFHHHILSTLIIDQHLEDTDGLHILKKVKSLDINKILMSNFIEQKDLHMAYNQGLINAFVPKMSHNFISQLQSTVMSLNKQFFIKLSEKIYNIQTTGKFLTEDAFAKYFDDLIRKLQITSYIAHENFNVFELHSQISPNNIYLFIAAEQDFEDLLNSIQAERASERVLEKIRRREAIPCVKTGEIPCGSLWSEYMQPVTTLKGENTYYVSCQTTF